MKHATHPFLIALLSLMILSFAATGMAQEAPASGARETLVELWDGVLREHVKPGRINGIDLNVVDYSGIAADARWARVLKMLENAQEPSEPTERKAFWINAYNILCINVVLRGYPVESINDLGGLLQSVWKKPAGLAAGEEYTLDEIEHAILRKMGDPLIHGGIVCASVSCPDLRAEAYRSKDLSAQLEEQMRRWLANPKKGAALDKDGKTLRLSKIFDWFGDDFTQGGHQTVVAAIAPYLPPEIAEKMKDSGRVDYFDYDWSLNDAQKSRLP